MVEELNCSKNIQMTTLQQGVFQCTGLSREKITETFDSLNFKKIFRRYTAIEGHLFFWFHLFYRAFFDH